MGVLVSELQDELDETGIVNSIPEDRLDLLIAKADRDGDSYVTFNEFINMVGYFFDLYVNVFISIVSPKADKDARKE